MMYLKVLGVFPLLFMVTACSSVKNVKYQDTSHLERPPEMEIVVQPKAQSKRVEKVENTGLGSSVIFLGKDEPVIKIKKTFDRSWGIVEQALKLNEIKITDKNRDEGTFYVLFDPDEKDSGESAIVSTLSFFLFRDDYAEGAYKLTVVWQENNTEVTVQLINEDSIDILDDGEDDGFDDSVDTGGKLLEALFKTIKDDLPLD